MSVNIELALRIEGDGAVEESLRQHCAWLERMSRYTPEYQEVQAYLAMAYARMCWREADHMRELNRHRAEVQQARGKKRS